MRGQLYLLIFFWEICSYIFLQPILQLIVNQFCNQFHKQLSTNFATNCQSMSQPIVNQLSTTQPQTPKILLPTMAKISDLWDLVFITCEVMGLCISVCPTLFSALQCTLRGRGQCETRAHASHFLLRLDVAGQLQLPDLEVSDGPDQSWQGPDTSSGATKVVDFPMKRNSGVWMKTCCSGSTKSFLRLSCPLM